MTKRTYGNAADDSVENYEYDYYFVNEKSLAEVKIEFCDFIFDIHNS